jgi:hypothetical protein
MAIKGFAAVLAALVVAGGMHSAAFAGKGEVKPITPPDVACGAKHEVGSDRYNTCVANKTANLPERQEKREDKALSKCDMLSPNKAKACKCAIDPALPICSASLS